LAVTQQLQGCQSCSVGAVACTARCPERDMAFNDGTCLCARGLPATCHEEDLDALFRGYGRVTNVRMPLEPITKANRGYAFVNVETNGDAQACISALNGVEFCGCRLAVEVSKRCAPHLKTPGVYLGNALRRESPLPRHGGLPSDRGPSAASRRSGSLGRSHSPLGAASRQPMGGSRQHHRTSGSSSCVLAEPLCEPAAAATPAATSSSCGRGGLGVGEPEAAAEPAFEPGGEPLIEEEPKCSTVGNSKLGEHFHVDSPRSRIRRLEEANVRAVGKQTADALLLQFQQQGFSDPRAAAQECLRISMELLGKSASCGAMSALDHSMAGQRPTVLLSPDEFKNPSSFLRVYGDPLAAAARRCGQPESHQDGNWRCEQCGNVNYPRRQRCHKCQVARGAKGDAIVLQYCLRIYEMLQKGKVVD